MIDQFLKFVEALKQNPTTVVLAILLALASFAAYSAIQNGELLKVIAPSPQAEAALFQRSLDASKDITVALDNLRYATGADEVVIRQFHNGRYDLTGIPFTSVSATYVSSDKTELDFSAKPLAYMGGTVRQMWQNLGDPRCVVYRGDIPDVGLRSELSMSSRTVICPLVSILKYPIGTLSLHYRTSSTNLTDDALIARTEGVSVRIAGYLNEKRG